MRIRTLALALALSFGAMPMVQAASQKNVVRKVKSVKPKKFKPQKYKPGKYKPGKYPVKVKQPKAKKVKQAKR